MLAQGRHMYIENVEPVIEVFPQFAIGDGIVGNLVGGGEHAHVHRGLDLAPEAPKFVVFQNPQQFGLCAHRHLSDLVQQQRAAFGEFETAGAAFQSPRKRALLVAKNFALDQGLGNRRAIDGDERFVAPRT